MVPSPITHSSGQLLEFEALREILRSYTSSPLGQARVAELVPSTDLPYIRGQQQLTAELREFLHAGNRFEFAGLLDPTVLINKSRIEGAALETLEIRDVIALVDRAAEWHEIVAHPPASMPEWIAVAELSAAIIDFTEFLRFFRKKILPDGTLDDRASPALAQVRREIEKQKRSIQESLRAYLRRLAEGGAVQEELVTIRGERFVIPVKVEQKKRVNGVVHSVSSSGQTVFIEPLETIEQNNELVRLLEEEQEEVHRILLEMTKRVAAEGDAIVAAAVVLAELELQYAKARFSEDYNCVTPEFPDAGSVRLLDIEAARHPLLERNLKARGAPIIPLTLSLGGNGAATGTASQRQEHATSSTRATGHSAEAAWQLVITGPNTGGKTVALKTVGLLALMAQAGMPIPAQRAVLPVFDAVLADIGDYQSIEQNLSTFSAHVTNIDFISRTATSDSLVLLDELGSATDPEEGAALAVAIAEHFRALRCTSIISTHHTSLKVYAANTPGVLNAAVGFDERTLQPTYDLQIGVPGASAGINIAQRLGLNPAIIDAARARMGSQAQDVGRFLDRLHAELREAEQERQSIRRREQELARAQNHLAAEGRKEQKERVREMERKLEDLLRDFEYRMRENVNAVQDRAAALKLSKDAERRIAKLRREFKEQFNQSVVAHHTGADVGDANARPALVRHVSQGDTVKLKSLGRNAKVTRKIDDNTFEVEMGLMKMRVPREDIAEVLNREADQKSDSPLQAARARGFSVSTSDEAGSAAASEINVIGENVDDAIRRVEKFLDHAFLAGLPRVRVVHGSGLGILRKALRQFLKDHPHVDTVSEPPQKEGGAGATVVELRV
jgi:DNA mismatch repair protein MutS2